ncbi:carbamate kinase [Enterococcus crotali]|uniref:carbamate kinase n=1 Tax=Enterococcus crotali TaxID=1453587 RepID=UPI000471AEAC|nr:carbamate kinase [Enterococcus crotali]
MKRVVVALGGNAILESDPTAAAQQKIVQETAESLASLLTDEMELVIVHGNGPQVGNLMLQQAAADSVENPAMPLDTCVAMTEGSIGYWLVNALTNALEKRKITREVAAVVTQVEVSQDDEGFAHPSKPIGPFLSESKAQELMEMTGASYMEDAGRGFRKVVPSPRPIAIKESKTIRLLLENGVVTVAGGGGGIPVVQSGDGLQGIEAVIDKDLTAEKLAELIEADTLIILTGVTNVFVHYNQPNQKALETVSISEIEHYIKEGQFASGSMLPKVEAAVQFAKRRPINKAVITSLENLKNLGKGELGTVVVQKEQVLNP